MAPTMRNNLVLAVATVVALVGCLDSLLSREWDFLAVFGLLLGSFVLLWFQLWSNRPAVPIRADLVGWMRTRAAESGEPLETVADRAIATYRHRLLSGLE